MTKQQNTAKSGIRGFKKLQTVNEQIV